MRRIWIEGRGSGDEDEGAAADGAVVLKLGFVGVGCCGKFLRLGSRGAGAGKAWLVHGNWDGE